MNIKSIINPLIFGREGIDDKLWKIKVSVTNSLIHSIARVRCRNTCLFKTKTGIEKTNTFNLMIFIDENGEIKLNRITLGEGQINSHLHKMILKDDLYKLFEKSINEQPIGKEYV